MRGPPPRTTHAHHAARGVCRGWCWAGWGSLRLATEVRRRPHSLAPCTADAAARVAACCALCHESASILQAQHMAGAKPPELPGAPASPSPVGLHEPRWRDALNRTFRALPATSRCPFVGLPRLAAARQTVCKVLKQRACWARCNATPPAPCLPTASSASWRRPPPARPEPPRRAALLCGTAPLPCPFWPRFDSGPYTICATASDYPTVLLPSAPLNTL